MNAVRTRSTSAIVLLGAGLYVILSKQYQTADTNWAYGIVGTVQVGYATNDN